MLPSLLANTKVEISYHRSNSVQFPPYENPLHSFAGCDTNRTDYFTDIFQIRELLGKTFEGQIFTAI